MWDGTLGWAPKDEVGGRVSENLGVEVWKGLWGCQGKLRRKSEVVGGGRDTRKHVGLLPPESGSGYTAEKTSC